MTCTRSAKAIKNNNKKTKSGAVYRRNTPTKKSEQKEGGGGQTADQKTKSPNRTQTGLTKQK